MKNKIVTLILLITIIIVLACRTTPPRNVKIIEERDPLVKNIEERDSMRIVTDTINKVSRKK